jgi:ubiquinone/menaquinone biosynthesis C-methylase UbiE
MPLHSFSTNQLEEIAQYVAQDWRRADGYYDLAEKEMDDRWDSMIWPLVQIADFTECLDLAAGHGRNTRKLLEQPACRRVYLVDVNEENIAFCHQRFADEQRVICIKNDGFNLTAVPDGEVTLFYCFDAMVHFDSDIVRSYLCEVRRVLHSQGLAFLHHSNYGDNPGGDVHDMPHWRNFMTAELFAHYAHKEGLAIERQLKIDWTHDQKFTDCFSLLKRR